MYSYIHIPFCNTKCKYCRFSSYTNLDKLSIKRYVSFLVNHINSYNLKTKKLNSIYFWWWTPSILESKDIWLVISCLKDKFWFQDDIEITLETTPWNITTKKIKELYEIWINRLSIWVQTLNEDSLKEIKRDSKWDIISSLDNLRKNLLIKNISLDFIIWLPFVKKWEVKKDILFLLEKYDFIKHISVYMLEDYYDLESDKQNNFDNIVYPDNWKTLWLKEEDYLWEYKEIRDFLEQKWFFRYELSNFSKPWFSCIHNQAYRNHSELLAFWLGSHWFIDNKRYAYSDSFSWYYKLEKSYEEKLSKKDLFLEELMFWLRTTWISESKIQFLNKEKLKYFFDLEFLYLEWWKIKLSDKGVLVLDYIIKEILI